MLEPVEDNQEPDAALAALSIKDPSVEELRNARYVRRLRERMEELEEKYPFDSQRNFELLMRAALELTCSSFLIDLRKEGAAQMIRLVLKMKKETDFESHQTMFFDAARIISQYNIPAEVFKQRSEPLDKLAEKMWIKLTEHRHLLNPHLEEGEMKEELSPRDMAVLRSVYFLDIRLKKVIATAGPNLGDALTNEFFRSFEFELAPEQWTTLKQVISQLETMKTEEERIDLMFWAYSCIDTCDEYLLNKKKEFLARCVESLNNLL